MKSRLRMIIFFIYKLIWWKATIYGITSWFDYTKYHRRQIVFYNFVVSLGLGEVKVEMDSGTKSEGEEDSQAFLGEKKTNLGRTPNHLTLSTTSTISAGSTGSQARLIQSSHQPENYQPITVKELGECIIDYRQFYIWWTIKALDTHGSY